VQTHVLSRDLLPRLRRPQSREMTINLPSLAQLDSSLCLCY
jgi:hypothetical protein